MLIYFENSVMHDMDFPFRFRYETLRSLLNKNGNALQIMSDLEADLNHLRHYDEQIRRPILKLITETLLMAQELNLLTKNQYADLYKTIFRLQNEIREVYKTGEASGDAPEVVMLAHGGLPEIHLIGGKAAGVQLLSKHFKENVPPGFVVTTAAYKNFLEKNDLTNRIRLMQTNLDVMTDQDQFRSRTRTIRKWIREATLPEDLEQEILRFADQITGGASDTLWAVRSSAVFEDGIKSFAGLFDSELQIKREHLAAAYKHVLASRFTDRAVKYRFHAGLREVDTPMAVLIMPMVEPLAAGVVYTTDPEQPDSDTLVINTVPELANRMVKGEVQADTFLISKGPSLKLKEAVSAERTDGAAMDLSYIPEETVLKIAGLAARATEIAGYDLDIEWAADKNGNIKLLQQRRLNIAAAESDYDGKRLRKKDVLPLIEGGITISPGRAEGPVRFVSSEADIPDIPEGAVVVLEKPEPEFAVILPKIAALLVREGNPVGHLATLVREFSVPCLYRLGENVNLLSGKNVISINATTRKIYTGIRWPGIRERVLARIASKGQQTKSGPLYDLVLKLTLLDPDAPTFKPKSCTSIHDTLRFMHEMAVRAMFGFGDTQKKGWHKKTKTLQTDLPINFQMIDLGGTIASTSKKVAPEDVASVPFNALWTGISDKRLQWPDRWKSEMAGMPSDFQETVLGGYKGPRRLSDTNYMIVAGDYLNINARFAYHYAMVDAMVGTATENNHVHFRFRGGGSADANRIRRARFLEAVLRESGFGVEQQGDLVTAWLRRYPRKDSEDALKILGRLMVCARQLDVVLKHDTDIKKYAAYFMDGNYNIFS